jgi:hypothetical protein
VAEGIVSAEAARALYGVVLRFDGEADAAATEALRIAMRAERSRTNMVAEIAGARCPSCAGNGHAVGIRERLMSTVGPAYTTGPQTTLSELICTQCGTLIDAQVTMQGAGPLLDGAPPPEQAR